MARWTLPSRSRLGVLPDHEIKRLCRAEPPLIEPFLPTSEGKPSYGLSSAGYDLRLGTRFLVPLERPGAVADPVGLARDLYREVVATQDFLLPPRSVALAETVEVLHMPDDVLGLIVGKSTYARCGLLVNATPVEPGWRGRLTLELANLSPHAIRLYVGRGIAQIVFFRLRRPLRTYGEKPVHHYQGQEGVTLP